MSNLTNNTAELNKILAAVNALPEAGGDGIVPTGTIEITENGTHDVTNYATAEVNVPSEKPVLEEGSAVPTKSQQTVEPPAGVDGFSKFVVEKIPDEYIVPEGTVGIIENGEHDVTGYAKVDVNVPDIPAVTEELNVTENGTYEPNSSVDGYSKVVVAVPDVPAVVQPLEVTENGTYEAPSGVDGYSPITVNVPSENLDAEISEQAAKIDQLLTILEGKAAGGSGAVNTCTVTINHYPSYNAAWAVSEIYYQSLSSDKNITVEYLNVPDGTIDLTTDIITLANVVYPSVMYAYSTGTTYVAGTNATLIAGNGALGYTVQINGDATVTFQPVG